MATQVNLLKRINSDIQSEKELGVETLSCGIQVAQPHISKALHVPMLLAD